METTRRFLATCRLSASAPSFARLIIVSVGLVLAAQLHAKPLKVFILAGQANMEGHAKIETFDYIGDDPATAPLLKMMRGADGKATVCDGAWISYFTGSGTNNGEGLGKLTAGYGSRSKPEQDGGKIGPEFTFGLTMDAALAEPVLIIKTAWGGRSLHTDFRPPSAGGVSAQRLPEEALLWPAGTRRSEGHGVVARGEEERHGALLPADD